MQFTIVGAGALGTILGAHLIAAGHDVTLIARGERARRIVADGLVVRGLSELSLPCRVLTPEHSPRAPGVLVFAVKTYHMEDALRALAGSRPEAVFSLANGVMKGDQLSTAFGASCVLGCMANFSGELLADGAVEFTRNVRLSLGGASGYGGASATALAATIAAAGIVSVAVDEIESVEWSKFIGWVALFALAVIARRTTGVFLGSPRFAALGVQLVCEAYSVAAARGIALIDASPVPVATLVRQAQAGDVPAAIATLRQTGAGFQTSSPGHRMSALQDLDAGRRLEVHETLGYVVAEARRFALPVPTLALCYDIAAGLDDLSVAASG